MALWINNAIVISPERSGPFAFIQVFTDFHSYSLSSKEAWERQEELNAINDSHLCWSIKTSQWEEWAETEEERAELIATAISDGLYAQVTERPF